MLFSQSELSRVRSEFYSISVALTCSPIELVKPPNERFIFATPDVDPSPTHPTIDMARRNNRNISS